MTNAATFLTLTLLNLSIAPAVQALEIPAGKWGMNSETLTPMSAEPIKEYNEECIEEDFDPAQMLANSDLGTQCQVLPTVDTDSEFNSNISCDMGQAGSSAGTMRITVDGNEARGEMQMSIAVAGQVMEMRNTWTGERLGACD
jgi:hypothetical protein